MRSISSTAQRVMAPCGKAASRVIAPSPVIGGTLSREETRGKVATSQPSEASIISPNMETEEVSMLMVVEHRQAQSRAANVGTDCAGEPVLQKPIFNPAQNEWAEHQKMKIAPYTISVESLLHLRQTVQRDSSEPGNQIQG